MIVINGRRYRWVIPQSERDRLRKKWKITAAKMEAVGVFLHQQVKDRHSSQGASSGTPWPGKFLKKVGYDDGRAILTGRSGELLKRWFSYGTDTAAYVANDLFYAYVHELGTVGASPPGILPTIRPKNAKALFIPITDRALSAVNVGGKFQATTGSVLKGVRLPLVKGRIKDGRLQRWNEAKGDYENGVPDFIFLPKSDIPPRPSLPVSDKEIAALVPFAVTVILES